MLNTVLAFSLILAAFGIALAVLLTFGVLDRRQISRLRSFTHAERESVVFIFENETLLDATPAARQLLDSGPRQGSAWAHFSTLLAPRFPHLGDWIKELAEVGEMQILSADGSNRLRAEWHDGVARISLEAAEPDSGPAVDRHSLSAMRHELDNLRANTDDLPAPLWREDRTGKITWCNSAYLDLADSVSGSETLRPWPPAKVFALSETTCVKSDEALALHRVALTPADQTTRRWFEISIRETADGNRLFLATPADRLVRAETSLQEFVTTLTKTFASLPIGLVIFDRARELALFNPALMDLTELPADFLISKPSLSAFLDKLREARMMPEPKDYKSWRRQMSDLVAAAQNGTYEETWSLPTGQTYRVTGRPHPDGAVALLFEDISAEISLTRRFRSEIETGQAALDALPQAIAIFAQNGILSVTNRGYGDLWEDDPTTSLADLSVDDVIARWQSRCAPTSAWNRVRSFVGHHGPREAWSTHVALKDGRQFALRVVPLARGATMIDFSAPQGTPALVSRSEGQLEQIAAEA